MSFGRSNEFRRWLALPTDSTSDVFATTDARLPILVVGAGPAGLAAMAALQRRGIPFEAVESHGRVGGIWDASNPLSSVYEGMRTVTSRHTTHLGPPMPRKWPDFVPHANAYSYLVQFAEQKALLPHVRLETRFVDAVKTDRGTWLATLEFARTHDRRRTNGGDFTSEAAGEAMTGAVAATMRKEAPASAAPADVTEREYRAVIIATGSHNRNHRAYPADLWNEATESGIDVLHSADYDNPSRIAGKRVLVVGIGNSGTDIADKISRVAERTLLSVRTPPWINPATILGTPCDKMAADSTWLPHWYQMASFHLIRRLAIGSLSRLGLSTPRYPLLDRVPVTDRGIVRAIREGRVAIRSNVTSLTGGVARFANQDQPEEPIDAVIFATGFARQYPLLPPLDADGKTLNELLTYFIFHRTEPGLAFMTEVVGTWSCWPIFVEQANALAAYFEAEQHGGPNVRQFNIRRHLPTPNFKGPLFGGANAYHIDYGRYSRALRELTVWLSKSG